MTSATRPLGEILDARQRFVVLFSLILCTAVNALDASIVAPAMPHVLADLGGFQLISWVFTAYLLPSTVVVAIVGKVSDMMGRKPFLIAGVAIFVLASAACGAAPTMLALIAARAVQGLGAGILNACAFATLGDLFTPRERAKYISFFIATFTLSSLAGPGIGGALTDGPGWRWCFLINLPVGAIAIAFLWFAMPSTRRGGQLRDVDFVGSGLLVVWTTALLLALEWGAQDYGFASVETLGCLAVAVVFLVLFLRQERGHPQAIFPLMLLRNRLFLHSNMINVASIAGTFAAIQYLPTFIQTGLGTSATKSGIVAMPQAVGILISSIIAGQIISRTGRYKVTVCIGACLIVSALVGLHTVNIGDSPWKIAALVGLMGLGGGLVGPSISGVIQSAVPHEFMGVATSTRQFFMQIAQVLTVAIFGLVFTATYTHSFASRSADLIASGVPAAAYAQFSDPTLPLDATRFAQVRQQIEAVPDGERLLQRAIDAERASIAEAIRNLFLGAGAVAVVLVILAFTVPEVPLRSTFSSPDEATEASEPALSH